RQQTFTPFNFNPDFYHLCGSNPYVVKLEKIQQQIKPSDHILLSKYIKLINTQFTNKNKHLDENVYFTVEHSFDIHKKQEGVCFKILPFLYDSKYNLLATLVIIQPKQFAGSAILRKHNITENKTYVYDHASKLFVSDEFIRLTDIECEIIHLSGMGVKEKDIAKKMNLTLPILKRNKTTIFEKLKVSSISEAIFVAYKRNYLNINTNNELE
ncbi:MAG: hypothetical protein ACRDCN_14420, partial [Tannerellaceae bacterium]